MGQVKFQSILIHIVLKCCLESFNHKSATPYDTLHELKRVFRSSSSAFIDSVLEIGPDTHQVIFLFFSYNCFESDLCLVCIMSNPIKGAYGTLDSSFLYPLSNTSIFIAISHKY